jgi:hypothetical protein
LFIQIDQLEIQTAGIYVQLGYQFIEWQKESERYEDRYSVMVNGKPEEVSYFKAAWVTAGFKQARVYRCINRAKDDMKANHPAPQGVLDLVANTGNLDLTKENVQEAIADAFLAAGQPENPTQLQVMSIAADACQRAAVAPVDDIVEFKAMLTTAMTFAQKHAIPIETVELTWDEILASIATSFGMPGATVTKEKAPIYNSVVDAIPQADLDAATGGAQ